MIRRLFICVCFLILGTLAAAVVALTCSIRALDDKDISYFRDPGWLPWGSGWTVLDTVPDEDLAWACSQGFEPRESSAGCEFAVRAVERRFFGTRQVALQEHIVNWNDYNCTYIYFSW